MKFATWNLYFRNIQQKSAVDFLQKEGIDIACLQELRPATVAHVKNSGFFHINYGTSYCYRNGKEAFLAIVSKLKPIRSEKVEIGDSHKTALTRIYGLDHQKNVFLYNDYLINGRKLRVFNIHLPFGFAPSRHLTSLEAVLNKLDGGINVVCGDFNSFGHFPWNLLLGLFNDSRWVDYQKNEIDSVKELAGRFSLKLSSEKSVTYPFLGTHIDYVIIPDSWSSYAYRTYENRCGSDHKLVVVDENEVC